MLWQEITETRLQAVQVVRNAGVGFGETADWGLAERWNVGYEMGKVKNTGSGSMAEAKGQYWAH